MAVDNTLMAILAKSLQTIAANLMAKPMVSTGRQHTQRLWHQQTGSTHRDYDISTEATHSPVKWERKDSWAGKKDNTKYKIENCSFLQFSIFILNKDYQTI